MPDTLILESAKTRFAGPVRISSLLSINKNLASATEHTMVSILGSPKMPLTTVGQNDRASDLVTRLAVLTRITPKFRVTGIAPAVASLQAVLKAAFAAEPGLEGVLSTEGMLSVRLRKPTDGSASTAISNHAWGTAIDFALDGFDAPGNTGATVPQFIATLVPFFNRAGWFSGIAFRDAMHFEVAEQTIRQWSNDGTLRPGSAMV